MTTSPATELQALRARLVKISGMIDRQAVIIHDGRELVERESTWPRPRKEVEEELERAVRFDVPMLLTEKVKAERRIAELEREIAVAKAQERRDAAAKATSGGRG